MKKLYRILNRILWGIIGIFIGRSIYKFYDYRVHPELYAMQSAPWYLSIELEAVATAVIAAVIFIILRILKRKMDKR